MPADDAPEGYAAALAELDEILLDLDRDDLDLDVLAERVQRASVLLARCRSRLEAARVDVERVVATLGDATDGV